MQKGPEAVFTPGPFEEFHSMKGRLSLLAPLNTALAIFSKRTNLAQLRNQSLPPRKTSK